MQSHKRILRVVAKNNGLDPDELLIALWDSYETRFEYLKNENSRIKTDDVISVRKFISKFKEGSSTKPTNKQIKPVEVIQREYDFSSVGRLGQITYLTKEEIFRIYRELVADFASEDDPIEPAGLRDESLLDAAISHPKTSYEGRIKYPTIESAAAALMYSLSQNHAFFNGNKRTAMVAMLVFLDRHNICTTSDCTEDDLFKVSLQVADHKLVEEIYLYPDAEIYELAKWIHARSKVMNKEERSITVKKFKQILKHFDCYFLDNGKVRRVIKPKYFFKLTKTLESTQAIANNIPEGNDLNLRLIKSIRKDLELTSEHGIDSDVFYTKGDFVTSDFINKYRNLLKRLSKL